MGLFFNRFTREPKKEIDVNAPPKQGIALFFSVLLHEFWELIKLNLIFILFCLPVVTIPIAITAMSKVILLMLMDKPFFVFGEFIAAFKAEWKRATVAGLVFFLSLAAALYGVLVYAYIMEIFFLHSCAIMLCIIFITAGFYLFPMLALLDIGLKGAFKNAALLVLLRLPYNFLTLLTVASLLLLILIFFPTSIMLVFLIFFALINLITTFCAYTGIKKFVIKEDQMT